MVSLILISLLLFIIYCIYISVLKRSPRIVFYLEKIPGPKTIPIIGNALDFLVTPGINTILNFLIILNKFKINT